MGNSSSRNDAIEIVKSKAKNGFKHIGDAANHYHPHRVAKQKNITKKDSDSSSSSSVFRYVPPKQSGHNGSAARFKLLEELTAFYVVHDYDNLMEGAIDVEGIVDWVVSGSGSRERLNKKLKDIFNENLDEFLEREKEAAKLQKEKQRKKNQAKALSEASLLQDPIPGPAQTLQQLVDSNTNNADGEVEHKNSLNNEAILNRPKARPRKRPTQQNWEPPVEKPADYTEEAIPKDLSALLTEFIRENAPDEPLEQAVEELVSFGQKRGMYTLDSYLLSKYGKDLKGNVATQFPPPSPSTPGGMFAAKFGVGIEKSILDEMQGKALRHDDDSDVNHDPSGVCSRFRLDTTSSSFNMCKCGHVKDEHPLGLRKASTMNAFPRKLSRNNSSATDNSNGDDNKPKFREGPIARVARGSELSPVDASSPHKFIIDLNATSYGLCKTCGLTSSDSLHRPPPLPSRPKAAKSEFSEACSNYALDVASSTFGVCAYCGFPRMHHKGHEMPPVKTTLERIFQRNSEKAKEPTADEPPIVSSQMQILLKKNVTIPDF